MTAPRAFRSLKRTAGMMWLAVPVMALLCGTPAYAWSTRPIILHGAHHREAAGTPARAPAVAVANNTSRAEFEALAAQCAPHVDAQTLAALVHVESGFNPYAIGVVGGRLTRQPTSLEEAVATARALAAQGYNFSLGLGQINRHNLARLGEDYSSIFDMCRNLRAGATILRECYGRSLERYGDEQRALRAALSCYYSGNFSTGFTQGYVQRVVASASRQAGVAVPPIPVTPATPAAPVIRPDSAVPQKPGRATGVAKMPTSAVPIAAAQHRPAKHRAAPWSACRERAPRQVVLTACNGGPCMRCIEAAR